MNQLTAAFYKITGAALLLMGIASLLGSFYLYKAPYQDVDLKKQRITNIKNCETKARKMKFSVTKNVKNGEVYIVSHGVSDWRIKLTNLSYVAGQCHGLSMDTFCMGKSCKDNKKRSVYGAFMSLKIAKPTSKPATKPNRKEKS